jgi:hypothetical protein
VSAWVAVTKLIIWSQSVDICCSKIRIFCIVPINVLMKNSWLKTTCEPLQQAALLSNQTTLRIRSWWTDKDYVPKTRCARLFRRYCANERESSWNGFAKFCANWLLRYRAQIHKVCSESDWKTQTSPQICTAWFESAVTCLLFICLTFWRTGEVKFDADHSCFNPRHL